MSLFQETCKWQINYTLPTAGWFGIAFFGPMSLMRGVALIAFEDNLLQLYNLEGIAQHTLVRNVTDCHTQYVNGEKEIKCNLEFNNEYLKYRDDPLKKIEKEKQYYWKYAFYNGSDPKNFGGAQEHTSDNKQGSLKMHFCAFNEPECDCLHCEYDKIKTTDEGESDCGNGKFIDCVLILVTVFVCLCSW
eukprot:344484_1